MQGLVIADQAIESHYYDIQSALLHTFLSNDYAILILEGYMMSLIKQDSIFYLFDSHARDSNGIPHPTGTAVVMKFKNVVNLEQHLYSLSMNLHVNAFEIVTVHLQVCTPPQQRSTKNLEYQEKRRSNENKCEKKIRLRKANEYKKLKLSKETDSQKQLRLLNKSSYTNKQRSHETDIQRQIRLQKVKESVKHKRSEETDIKKNIRLQKVNESVKRKRSQETDIQRGTRFEKDRLYKKQKRDKPALQQDSIMNREMYLRMFDNTSNGGTEEQCWAKASISKFHNSLQFHMTHSDGRYYRHGIEIIDTCKSIDTFDTRQKYW